MKCKKKIEDIRHQLNQEFESSKKKRNNEELQLRIEEARIKQEEVEELKKRKTTIV